MLENQRRTIDQIDDETFSESGKNKSALCFCHNRSESKSAFNDSALEISYSFHNTQTLHLASCECNFLSEKFQVQETLPFHLVQPFYLLTLPKSSHLPCPSLACPRFLNSNSNSALLFISVHVQRWVLCVTQGPAGCIG